MVIVKYVSFKIYIYTKIPKRECGFKVAFMAGFQTRNSLFITKANTIILTEKNVLTEKTAGFFSDVK